MSGLKLWLDDVRDPPDSTWTLARTASEAIHWLDTGEFRADILDQLRDLKSEVEIAIDEETADEHAAALLVYLDECYLRYDEATVCNEAGEALFIGHVLGCDREIYPRLRHTFKLLGKAV